MPNINVCCKNLECSQHKEVYSLPADSPFFCTSCGGRLIPVDDSSDNIIIPLTVEVSLTTDPTVNFAMQQNDVPVIKELCIKNLGDTLLKNLILDLSAEPEFASEKQLHIAVIPPGGTHRLGVIDWPLSPGYLRRITEGLVGEIRLQVSAPGHTPVLHTNRIEILGFDEWSGLRSLPEILAAFVLPNHPDVETVLGRAATILGEQTGDSALSGYQSKSRERVLAIAGAIIGALKENNLNYCNPPASFEKQGQKIRTPDRILGKGLGTCLDLAVMVAACLEQAGLNPLVLLIQGHAFCGVWLDEDCFAESAVEDVLRIRKRVDLGEICVIEATLLTQNAASSFMQMLVAGRKHLDSPDAFHCAIDIRRARMSRIRPLPSIREDQLANESGAIEQNSQTGESSRTIPPTFDIQALVPSSNVIQSPQQISPTTRLDIWKRKLLDLSLNNRLLNFKETKRTIPILCPELATLEDVLAQGTLLRVLPKPADWQEDGLRNAEMHNRRTGTDALNDLLRSEFEQQRLRADITQSELDRRILELFRAAQTSIEEGGANTLFLALGFLVWYESKASVAPRLAPIILVPLELNRKSVREGFFIRRADEDPRVNSTLLEMLNKDFGISIPGMDPPPIDDYGLDVPLMLRSFREAVKDVDRFDVMEKAHIGLFSFTKYLMWRDLQDRSTDLTKNKLVAHLTGKSESSFFDGGNFPDPAQLDKTHSPEETFCPLLADSSQLAAVYAAGEGKTFILEGPPGTGKSQTITNIIAHSLANGKKVLFISEKIAALNVVYGRLVQNGLGDFCLQLHSNKSSKMEVLQQFQRSLNGAKPLKEGQWREEAHRLSKLRSELNSYVEALHKVQETGESAFWGFSRLIELRHAPPLELGWDQNKNLSADDLFRIRETVSNMNEILKICDSPSGHVWSAAGCDFFSPAFQREVATSMQELTACIEALAQAAGKVSPLLRVGGGNFGLSGFQFIYKLSGMFLKTPELPASLLNGPNWKNISIFINKLIKHGQDRDGLRKEVSSRYNQDILNLDIEGLLQKWAATRQMWFLKRKYTRYSIRRFLGQAAKPGCRPTKENVLSDMEKARDLKREEELIRSASDKAKVLLGKYWKNGEADWTTIERIRDWGAAFIAMAQQAAPSHPEKAASLLAHWAQMSAQGKEKLGQNGQWGLILSEYRLAFESFAKERQGLANKLRLSMEEAFGPQAQLGLLGKMKARIEQWNQNMLQLHAWCRWRAIRNEAVSLGLDGLVVALEKGTVSPDEMENAFHRGYFQWWIEKITGNDPALNEFFSPNFEKKIDKFRQLDESYTKLARLEIQARARSRVPSSGSRLSDQSEMGILMHQIGKKRGHLPIRALFQKIPNLLPRLTPCLLMSPISVAQYLDAAHQPFDLVVFDEASQIPVWDAVGAIARGREAVIVGDPKQLPPTNFFNRSDDQESDDEDSLEDLESILDDCIAAQVPKMRLSWHYRSRHESLIAFSNRKYYDNSLLTFPSPDRKKGVVLRPVPTGVYDKGRTRTNKAEAEAVVAEILRRLRNPDLARFSIGVVTFNISQQTLVEDLLESARSKHPEIEPYFDREGVVEPVFVKNLENVQGDERDVILFSICYGPDAQKRVAMNFGPLNRDGGERRLNVAITRARREVLVFSTLEAKMIDLARTRAVGVQDLKYFLEYADRGMAALEASSFPGNDDSFDSPFEKEVCMALKKRGHMVHTQVGCSGYRIDLAVVDPMAPGRYVLGIECDGANYHSAKTARDRDRLRQMVLTGLGWSIHRIWSTDFWTNPDAELDKAEVAIIEGQSHQTQEPEEAPELEPIQPEDTLQESVEVTSSSFTMPATYEAFSITKMLGNPDSFRQYSAEALIQDLIVKIVNKEGPVSAALAARRVAAHWGIPRTNEGIITKIVKTAKKAGLKTVSYNKRVFLWPGNLDPATYESFRVVGASAEQKRQTADLPPEEVANAALEVLSEQVSLPMDDLIRETARMLGYKRMGDRLDEIIREGIKLLLDRNAAFEADGIVVKA